VLAAGEADILAQMTVHLSRTLGMLLAVAILAGCEQPLDPMMSKEAVATRAAPAEHVFQGELGGAPVFLLLHDCEVYRVESRGAGQIHWESVLAPDFYPFWTVCQRQSMAYQAGALTVTLGRMAFGAGGCCATGGTYRTVDGRTWKKLS
jgi:hypothetical protein